jgi:hypothetical protein
MATQSNATQSNASNDSKFKVLIVDQFSGVSPYYLQKNPMRFDELVTEILESNARPWRQPRVEEVSNDFQPPMCTTVVRADKDGMAEVWKYRWDSSG